MDPQSYEEKIQGGRSLSKQLLLALQQVFFCCNLLSDRKRIWGKPFLVVNHPVHYIEAANQKGLKSLTWFMKLLFGLKQNRLSRPLSLFLLSCDGGCQWTHNGLYLWGYGLGERAMKTAYKKKKNRHLLFGELLMRNGTSSSIGFYIQLGIS